MDDEANALYSSNIHKAIIFSNGGALALLQLLTSQSSWAPAKSSSVRGSITILFFLAFILIYVVLGVCEVKLQNKPPIRYFIGHISHLIGLLLISLTAPIFTLIVFPLTLGWFLFIMYCSFSQLKENESETPAQLYA